MGIRKYNPTTPGRRGATVSDFAELTPGAKPVKSLLTPKKRKGGRNNQGKITARHRGGGHKRPVPADRLPPQQGRHSGAWSTRSSTIRTAAPGSPCCTTPTARSATSWPPKGLKAGDQVLSGHGRAGGRGQLPAAVGDSAGHGRSQHRDAARAAAACCAGRRASAPRLAARDADWAQINLPSGEIRRVPATCRATIGTVGNSDHMGIVLGKAGRKRWMGRRPHVRGTAMNPIDHPHGGGEGRTKGGRHPVSPTGKLAKGGSTRKRRKPSNKAIVRRRKSRRYGQLKIK